MVPPFGLFLALLAFVPGRHILCEWEEDMRRQRSAALITGVFLAAATMGQATAADDEILQLKRQLSEQRQLMETMERRLGEQE
jgi:hypothetical protein